MVKVKQSTVRIVLRVAMLFTASSVWGNEGVTREEVERAIRNGVRYLRSQQREEGSWSEADKVSKSGTTALATLALLSAGEPIDDRCVRRALAYLYVESFERGDMRATYTVALQTMVFAQADPTRYRARLQANVRWLERAQIKPRDGVPWPGSWTYSDRKANNGDNSNTQYALLGLYAASKAGTAVHPEVWNLSRRYWEFAQLRAEHDRGAWGYRADSTDGYGSMTCAGITSLIMCGALPKRGREFLVGASVQSCGKAADRPLRAGLAWLSANFRGSANPERGQQWKYYYLRDLELVGQLTGLKYLGGHNWYAEGAEELVRDQDRLSGRWTGALSAEGNPAVATSFALLFLAEGRSPVLINKAVHGPVNDWNNDPDDVGNLVELTSRDWKSRVTWQLLDPATAKPGELSGTPILFFNGHRPPEFSPEAKMKLREYGSNGGTILAEACCSNPAFDQGFRKLIREIFPEPGFELHPLPPRHAIWSRRHRLDADDHPLWGVEHGGRAIVIYSPKDLSCFWNQMQRKHDNSAVIKASRIGQNIVDYATGRTLPPDKPSLRQIRNR